jgi:hypothetical protein
VILGQENVSLYGAPWRLDYLSFLQEIWLLGESYQKQVSMGNGIFGYCTAQNSAWQAGRQFAIRRVSVKFGQVLLVGSTSLICRTREFKV